MDKIAQRRKPDAIVLNSNDTVATATRTILKGQTISIQSVNKRVSLDVTEHIQAGHKIALVSISKGDPVIKFGEIIGEATTNISHGRHVHIHNIRSLHGKSKSLKI